MDLYGGIRDAGSDAKNESDRHKKDKANGKLTNLYKSISA
jgi:hypothetical protein